MYMYHKIKETLNDLQREDAKRNKTRVIEIKVTTTPDKVEKIKELVERDFGAKGMNIVFEDQIVGNFFDKIEWTEVKL